MGFSRAGVLPTCLAYNKVLKFKHLPHNLSTPYTYKYEYFKIRKLINEVLELSKIIDTENENNLLGEVSGVQELADSDPKEKQMVIQVMIDSTIS